MERCKIISVKFAKDILKSTNDTQDVMIGNLESTNQPSITNDVAACIETSNPVVISDFKLPISENKLRKAAVVILAFASVNKVSLCDLHSKMKLIELFFQFMILLGNNYEHGPKTPLWNCLASHD